MRPTTRKIGSQEMKHQFTTFVVCIALGLLMAAPAVAQTPDGATPANEGVCDDLKGFTPGLYGLSVAFCEAQDRAALSKPITEEDLELLEDSVPSGRILANYRDVPNVRPISSANESAVRSNFSNSVPKTQRDAEPVQHLTRPSQELEELRKGGCLENPTELADR